MFTLVVGAAVLLSHEYKTVGYQLISATLFTTNITSLLEAGYFDANNLSKPLIHLWSLSVEEQFYILWPLFILYFLRANRHPRLTAVGAIILISLALWIYLNKINAILSFYIPITRFWSAVAIRLKNNPAIDAPQMTSESATRLLFYAVREAPAVLGFVLVACAVYLGSDKTENYETFTIFAIIGSVAIILLGAKSILVRVLLGNVAATWVGKISYPLYLWHWPLLSYAYIMDNNNVPTAEVRLMIIGLSFILAAATYYFIEYPIRFNAKNKPRTAALLCCTLLMCAGLSVLVVYKDGLPDRYPEKELLYDTTVATTYPAVSELKCNDYEKLVGIYLTEDTECYLSQDAKPNVIFVGDSHMLQYRHAIWEHLGGESLMFLTHPSCLPFSSKGETPTRRVSLAEIEKCEKNYNALLTYFERQKGQGTVVLAGFWAYLISGDFDVADSDIRIPAKPTDEAIQRFEDRAVQLLNIVAQSSSRVILLQDIPFLDFNIRTCFDIRPFRVVSPRIRQDCTLNLDEYKKFIMPYDRVMQRILDRYPSIEIFDPVDSLCAGGVCSAMKNGLPIYRNGDHVNNIGAKLIMDEFMKMYRQGAQNNYLPTQRKRSNQALF